MKKILALVLVLVMMLSMTACGFHQGDLKKQEAGLLAFVKQYYGEAEVVEKEAAILDTASVYTLKDKKDGFTYPMTALEVYMSDLGFVTAEGETDAKTIVFDGQFITKYVSNLVINKIPDAEMKELAAKYPDTLVDISIFERETTAASVFKITSDETVLIMQSLDEEAIYAAAALMEKYDERHVLHDYMMPIYKGGMVDGESTPTYDATGKVVLLGYYDFYLDYIIPPTEFDGIATLHDYLLGSEHADKDIKITVVSTDVPSSAVTTETGFAFAPSLSQTGDLIMLTIDGVAYEFYTLLGYKAFETETDEFGIREGSFLDVLNPEKTGGKDVLVASYALSYPGLYTNLTLHFKQITATSQPVPDGEENTNEEVPSDETQEKEDAQ